MIKITNKGSFDKTESFLKKQNFSHLKRVLEPYAERGVAALSAATPKDSGKTAASWGYEIVERKNGISIIWTNSNENNGVKVAILIQYGHGTGTGGYIQGRDYINPAMRPIFDDMADAAWREVSS